MCALLALKDANWGWAHQPPRRPKAAAELGGCGWAAVAMCAAYMATDMSGLGEVGTLPDNPGSVFKSPDVAYKSRVWERWGYGQVTMR